MRQDLAEAATLYHPVQSSSIGQSNKDTVDDIYVNVGCGPSPTPNWHNYDNSWSLRITPFYSIAKILQQFHLLSKNQVNHIEFSRSSGVRWANVAKHIPEKDSSVQAAYSCHLLEYLSPADARRFLHEAARVLKPLGIIRIAVPNLTNFVEDYQRDGDADVFMRRMNTYYGWPPTAQGKIRYLFFGFRGHRWMYDGRSLCRMVEEAGFVDAVELPAGETMIAEPGALNTRERHEETVYVEARKPGGTASTS